MLGQSVLTLPYLGIGRLARNTLPDSWRAVVAGVPSWLVTLATVGRGLLRAMHAGHKD